MLCLTAVFSLSHHGCSMWCAAAGGDVSCCSLLFYDHVALFKLYQISHGRYRPFTPCWHLHNCLLRIHLISPIIRIGIASYTSIFFCASDLLHYHWANIVLEYHPIVLVQIEIGEAFEERHRAMMDQSSSGSAGFIVVHGFVIFWRKMHVNTTEG